MKQYMPLKPVKCGYKIECLCDSSNGYAYNIQVYTGASNGSVEDTLGSRVVKTMMELLRGKGHHVYMDNSMKLAKYLLLDNTQMIETAQSGRKGWLQEIKDVKALRKSLKRGESRSVLV
jgi:hypothetical protein